MNIYIHSDAPLLKRLKDSPIDGVVLGVRPFAQRMRETYVPKDLAPLINDARNQGKRVLLNMNAIIHEGDLEALDHVFTEIKGLDFEGILFADLAIANKARDHGLNDRLIYDAETYLTNHQDMVFWEEEGIQGAIGARQLTIDDILEISGKSGLPFGILGHGHVNMFHSARPLVENFFRHTDEEVPKQYNNTRVELVEHKRKDEPYPTYQDDFGTHVFRSKPMHGFNVIERLKDAIDYFIVDTLFYSEDRVVEIARDLMKARDEGVDAALLARYEDHDEGFLHKKTVFKQGTVR